MADEKALDDLIKHIKDTLARHLHALRISNDHLESLKQHAARYFDVTGKDRLTLTTEAKEIVRENGTIFLRSIGESEIKANLKKTPKANNDPVV